MSLLPLTAAQERLLRFIETTLQRRGYPPSLGEMAQAMGAAFRSGVQVHLRALERKGYIRRGVGQSRALEVLHPLLPASGTVPILGRVAAGRPVLAVENYDGTLSLGPDLLGQGPHFALQVHGDSMLGVGIVEGDYVLVRQQDTAEVGEIVIALLGEDATVKRLRKRGRLLVLEAANPAYAPIPLTQSTPPPRILGKVVGVYHPLEPSR
jgi:repressor LexA